MALFLVPQFLRDPGLNGMGNGPSSEYDPNNVIVVPSRNRRPSGALSPVPQPVVRKSKSVDARMSQRLATTASVPALPLSGGISANTTSPLSMAIGPHSVARASTTSATTNSNTRTTRISLERSNTASSTRTNGRAASVLSTASFATSSSIAAASDPVLAFSFALPSCKWVFTRKAAASARDPADAWTYEAIPTVPPPGFETKPLVVGLVTFDPAEGRCTLNPIDASTLDNKSHIISEFAWRQSYLADAVKSNTARLPLSRAEADSPFNGTFASLQNAFTAVVDALQDALLEMLNYDYNKDLSDQYDSSVSGASGRAPGNDTDSLFSTQHDTLSSGLILTQRELKLLEYSVKKKCGALCGIVSTLGNSAVCLLVKIGYEPRAVNEVELRKGDWFSLWWIFDVEFGFGLNKTNGQIGYVTLGHLDPRRLSLATQPPPLPSHSGVAVPKKPPTSPAIPLPAGMHSPSQRSYMPTTPSTASTVPFITPTPGMSASQQRMSMLLQMSTASSTPPPSVARPHPPVFPPSPPSNISQRSRSIESNAHASPATAPQLRISDRLAARQADAARYDHMESELESLLSMPVAGAPSSPVRGKRGSSLGSLSSRSSSLPGAGVRVGEVSASPTQMRGSRNARRESLTASGAGQEGTAVQGMAVMVPPITPYSLFAMPPPAPAEDSADNILEENV